MGRWMFIVFAGCARATSEPPTTDASNTADAKQFLDAPVSSGNCTMPFTGPLANWTFTGESGDQASTMVTTKAPGITAGNVARSGGLTAVSGASSINSSGWPTAAQRDTTKYYTFSVKPPAGCTLSLTSVSTDARASGTGPVSAVVSTSVDNYTATSTVSTSTPGMVALTIMDAANTVELRVYGYAAGGAGGTLRLQTTLTVDGQIK